jgi:tRNA threonylcarbamoyladenosine biosynthesis protein TsaE
VQDYDTRLGRIHHFDLWRLDGPAPLGELGWDEACDAIVLVEWPDRLGALRPTDALTIALQPADAPNARRATLTWADKRLDALA